MSSKKKSKKNTRITKSVVNFTKFLQFLSVPLAGDFVLKIFQTPLHHTMPQREEVMYKSAIKERLKINTINKEIQVYKYGYAKKKVLVLHGWAGRGTQLFTISDMLLEKGYMIISIDGPAHGFSEGKRTNITEFVETLKTIQAGNDVREVIHDLASKLQLKSAVADYILKKLQKQFNSDLETISSAASAQKINIPTLVIHDTDDKEVPVSCAYQIRQNLSKGCLLITHGLGHQRILKDNSVQNRIIEFLNQ